MKNRFKTTLILLLLISFCGGESSVTQSNNTNASTENSVNTTRSNQATMNSFTPKVNHPDQLINNLFYLLSDEIEVEIEKWEEVNNPDCENSSLNSCGITDIFAETALENLKRNSLLISILKANMSFVEFYDYFLEEINNCDEVFEWYLSNGGISYKLGDLNLLEACNNLSNSTNILTSYLEEIEEFEKNNSYYIQEMYCNATSQNMKTLIHNIIISGDMKSLFYANITPGASWSYCPTDNEYPPQDNS